MSAAGRPGINVSLASAVTDATDISVIRRTSLIKEALKIHDKCRKLLRARNIRCPRNLNASITKCFDKKLIDKKQRSAWYAVCTLRNKAVHEWN